MVRIVAPTFFAIAVIIGLIGGAPAPSKAFQATPAAAASPTPDGLCTADTPADWRSGDVRPNGVTDAAVIPAAETAPAEPTPVRELYLVVITLPPGHCMPYSTLGNQKDGAIVLIVQQGHLEFKWQPDPSVSGTPTVMRGNSSGIVDAAPEDDTTEAVPPDVTQDLYPGDWITLDQQVRFSYRNIGGDSAIILKAVWAKPLDVRCGGGCK